MSALAQQLSGRQRGLALLLALLWCLSGVTLARHAPSHIDDALGSHLNATQDCSFGVHGHGVALATVSPQFPCVAAAQRFQLDLHRPITRRSTHSTQARAPPRSV